MDAVFEKVQRNFTASQLNWPNVGFHPSQFTTNTIVNDSVFVLTVMDGFQKVWRLKVSMSRDYELKK
jgi:hypothetical protein